MSTFTIHDLESAPEGSRAMLEASQKRAGMIPNLHGVMAESPAVLAGYQQLHELFQKSSFNKDEITVVWQSINVEHGCRYCVPAHTVIANSMGVDESLTQALREGAPLQDDKLQVLQDTTLALVRSRGQLSAAQQQAFYDAGYSQRHLLDIVLGIAQKVMSNYINHLADTPLDEPFKAHAWEPS